MVGVHTAVVRVDSSGQTDFRIARDNTADSVLLISLQIQDPKIGKKS
jgi:hypothetical protein